MTGKLSVLDAAGIVGLSKSPVQTRPERVWTTPIYPAIGGARSDFWFE